MGEEKKESSIPWIWISDYVIIITALFQFLTCFVGSTTYSWALDHSMSTPWESPFPQGSYFLLSILFLLSLVNPALSKKLSKENLALLYIATLCATSSSGYPGRYNLMGATLNGRISDLRIEVITPEFWMPPKEYCLPALFGEAPVPWYAWTLALFTWAGVPIVMFLLHTSLFVLVRKQWIDVENMPYPSATVASELIQYLTAEGNKDIKARKRAALLGFTLVFLFLLPYVLIPLYPWIPDPYGYKKYSSKLRFGWVDGREVIPLLSSILHYFESRCININPLWVLVAYLAPLPVLNAVVIGLLIKVIGANVLVTMGYPNYWSGDNIGRNWPFNFYSFVQPGMTLGLTIAWLVFNRGYIKGVLRAIIHGNSPTTSNDEEPMSYRTAITIVVISATIMYVFTILTGVRADVGLLIVMGAVIWEQWIWGRIYGMSAFSQGTNWSEGGSIYYAWFYVNPATNRVYPWIPKDIYADLTIGRELHWTACLSKQYLRTASSQGWSWGWAFWIGDAFKLASLINISKKKVFAVSLLSTVLSNIIAPLIIIQVWYIYGAKLIPARLEPTFRVEISDLEQNPGSWKPLMSVGGPWSMWPWYLGGFIFAILLELARLRLTWWPLNPVGFCLAWIHQGCKYGIDQMMALAWIIKLITLKVGGTRAYEKYGVPFVVGGIAGFTLHLFLHNVACTYKWLMGL